MESKTNMLFQFFYKNFFVFLLKLDDIYKYYFFYILVT